MAVLSNNQTKSQTDKDKELSLGGGGESAGGAIGMGAAPAAGKPAASGQFTNVQSYVGANKNAGQKLAGAIGNRINNQVTQAESKVKNVGAFGSNVQGEAQRLGEGTTFQTQVKANPITITEDQAAKERFSKLLNQQNISQEQQKQLGTLAQTANQGLTNAGQQVANLGSETGRFSLLRDTLGRPTYSTGQQRLDQALFQIGGAKQLTEAQKQQSNRVMSATGQLTTDQAKLNQDILNNIALTGKVSGDLRNTLTAEDTGFTNAQSAEAKALADERVKQNTAINTFFNQGVDALTDPAQKKFIQDQLAAGKLGFDTRTYNVLNNGAKDYITTGNTNLSAKDVVDQQDLARYNALLSLAERDPTTAAYTGVGNTGAASAIKAANLATNIQAARTGLENRFRTENMTGTGVEDRTTTGAWGNDVFRKSVYNPNDRAGETWTYNANQNALSLLNDLEAKRTAQINAQAVRDMYLTGGANANDQGRTEGDIRTGFNPIQVGLNTGTGQANATGIDAPGAANQAAANLWQQFLARLNTEGYNNTLGKSKPR